MRLLRKLRLAFTAPSDLRRTQQQQADRERELIASLAHGNILLQFARIYTKEDVDRKFEKYRNVAFHANI